MRLRASLALSALVMGSAIAANPTTGAAAAAPPTPRPDGSSSAAAGPSCWGIKQDHPGSADGPYWLLTAALGQPERFFCDMTTDGGGWVLVARGREGWTFNDGGQRSAAVVRDVPSGPGAFAPAALPRTTIDALLDGGRVDALTDGIRISRSADTAGTTNQELRWFPAAQPGWNWALGGGVVLDRATVDDVTYAGGNTADSMKDYNAQTLNALRGINDKRRWTTAPLTIHNKQPGFGYGAPVAGVNNATSHLWQYTTEKNAIPFARVFLRPRISDSALPLVPEDGLPSKPVADQLGNKPEVAPWGVVGLAPRAERVEPEGRILVMSFQQVGRRMFVGGRFASVQQGKAGAPVSQPYLAAFDVDTGAWLQDFRPVLDGRVWDMAVSPSGKLIVAGDFTSVGGVPDTSGMAALDPVTGAVDTSFVASFSRTDTTGFPAMVRAIDVQDGFVYAGGTFNGYKGGTWNPIKLSRVVKLSATTGTPAQAWKPAVGGAVVDLDVSDRGDRVYLVGYFSSTNGDPSKGYSAQVTTSTGANVPGLAAWLPTNPQSTRGKYQQAVLEVGERVYQGGSEHNAQVYDRSTYGLQFSHTFNAGGDIQAIAEVGGRIYVGCHCNQWGYEGSNTWPTPTRYLQPNPVTWVGEYDPVTFRANPGFQPTVENGTGGEGPWALEGDTEGCLWFGGDFTQRGFTGADSDWLGGFGKLCRVEQVPPTTPQDLQVTAEGSSAVLRWQASSDQVGPVRYLVLRDDRVVATTANLNWTETGAPAGRYRVRAADGAGNLSATSASVRFNPPASSLGTLVAAGSTWRYLANGSPIGDGWTARGYDVSAWPTGPAQLGWGDGDEATVLPSGPVTSYFATTFNVADSAQVRALRVRLLKDDGAVVYVNGVEVRRDNLPAGRLTGSTPADFFISGTPETTFTDVLVPGSLLVDGVNDLKVELHQGGANNGDGSFDLQLDALGAAADVQAPTAPTLTASGQARQVTLTWGGATDDEGVEGYVLTRGDGRRTVLPVTASSFVDAGLGDDQTWSYTLLAYDRAGNESPSTSATATTGPSPVLVPFRSSWRFLFSAAGPAADWTTADVSTWSRGNAELGFGDGDEVTVLVPGTPRPTTAYFRTDVQVSSADPSATLTLRLVRDDGAAVYLNGVELVRDNLPDGPLAPSTKALVGQSTRAQESSPVVFTVPATALRTGSNSVAVEVHNLDPSGSDLSFDLQVERR